MSDYQVKRSYRDQILVMPPDAGPLQGEWVTSKDNKRYFRCHSKEAMPYGRTSKAGEHLKGGGDGLAKHKSAMAAIGVLMHEESRYEIETLINDYDGDPYYKGDDGGTRSGKSRLLSAVDQAAKVAGSGTAGARGTAFHKLGELVNKGKIPRVVSPALAGPLRHYRERVAKIEFLAQEILIINDELKRAGSIDYLMRLPAGMVTPDGEVHENPMVVSGDLKTGKWDVSYPAGVSAQLAGYGKGVRYDQDTNTRSPLHEDLNTRWGVMVHYPLASPDPEVKFYWVDLDLGLRAALVNNAVDLMIAEFKSVRGKPKEFAL